MKAAIAPVQEIPCAAMGAIAAIIAERAATIDGDVPLTLLAALAVGTLATGMSMVLLGALRLGYIVRFIPYPVIGGFLVGTGWLILLGGLGIVLAQPADLTVFMSVPEPGALTRLGVAGVFVLCLVVAGRVYRDSTVLPLVVIAGIGLFNVVVLLAGISHDDLHAAGWLVDLPEDGGLSPAGGTEIFAAVDWSAVAASAVAVPVVVVLTTVGLLLNATGIELQRRQDVDLDRELRAIGAGNTLAGLAGGLPGFQSVSLTLLATRLGAESRSVGFVAAAVIVVVLLFGVGVIDIFPTPVIGGLLIWMGASLMIEWLVLRWRYAAGWDLAIVILIFAVIVIVGFAQGIAVGLIAALILFAYQYAKVDVVRDEMSGDEYRSHLVGSTLPRDWLDRYGKAISVIRLKGYLFFGTADQLRRHVQKQIHRASSYGSAFLVIDFQRVTGIDSSAASAFQRLVQVASRTGVSIVATGLKEAERALLTGESIGGEDHAIRFEPDLESGVTWCEQALLSGIAADRPAAESRPLADMIADLVGDGAAAEAIAGHCRRVIVEPGKALISQGDPSNALYFIEAGGASVEAIDGRGATSVRLARVGAGDIVGEITFYLDEKRSGSVIADDEMVVWQLSSEALVKLSAEAPDAVARLHRGVATMLSGRLARASRYIGRLID